MSRKHFQMFADEINAEYCTNLRNLGDEKASLIMSHQMFLVKKVAIEANPHFDPARFELACLPKNEAI